MTGSSFYVRPERASERGMALVAALLLMMVMSGLAIALLASGRIETAMGDNEELYTGARAASEAGLNHTAAIILQLTADPVYSLDTLINGPDALADPAHRLRVRECRQRPGFPSARRHRAVGGGSQ